MTLNPSSLKLSAACVAVLALAGCASTGKFSCKAPDGVACMSTQQVYDLTSGNLPADSAPAAKRKKRGGSGNFVGHQIGAVGDSLVLAAPAKVQSAGRGSSLSLGGYNTPAQTMTTSRTLPALGGHPVGRSENIARLPAQVLRIWVAPWTDESGDLHMPGYVYSEIKARRWSVGGSAQLPESPANQFDPNAWQPPAGAP